MRIRQLPRERLSKYDNYPPNPFLTPRDHLLLAIMGGAAEQQGLSAEDPACRRMHMRELRRLQVRWYGDLPGGTIAQEEMLQMVETRASWIGRVFHAGLDDYAAHRQLSGGYHPEEIDFLDMMRGWQSEAAPFGIHLKTDPLQMGLFTQVSR